MRLPQLTAERALAAPLNELHACGTATARQQVRPMVDSGCLESCVGAQAASECTRECGTDIGCWNHCAGSGSASCVQACFNEG